MKINLSRDGHQQPQTVNYFETLRDELEEIERRPTKGDLLT